MADRIWCGQGACNHIPLIAFLHALCAPGEMLGWSVIVLHTVEQFITQNLPASASGQAQCAALHFGLAAVAGELATAFGVTGWRTAPPQPLHAYACMGGWPSVAAPEISRAMRFWRD